MLWDMPWDNVRATENKCTLFTQNVKKDEGKNV